MNSAIMAFLHHLAAFTLVGTLIYEHTAFRKDITFAEAAQAPAAWTSSTGSLPGLF